MVAEPLWDPLGIEELAALLTDVDARWWLSGGWAIEEFVCSGHSTRRHGDVDISVPSSDWPTLWHALNARFELRVAQAGSLDRSAGENAGLGLGVRNIWARERTGGPWRMQINLEETSGDHWIYRRDHRVSRLLTQVRWRSARTWCGAPAVQLLWKAKTPRVKDEHDWTITVSKLPDAELVWLGCAITTAHPRSA